MSQENVEIVRGVRYRVTLPSESASQRRILEERLFVRFPALFRLFTDAWMRLPPRSRVRRLLLTRLMQRGFAATNRRDFDLLITGLDPEIESRPPRSKMGGLIAPDLDQVAYGREGYREMWRTILDAVDLRLEPEELLDLGDTVLATIQWRGSGLGSGAPVSQRGFQLLKFRRGLLVWSQEFTDRDQALEAAGLRE
jgi:ketosteroid isomerase-like protein